MTRVTTLTSKGQVTIPKEVRDKLDLQPHDRITFVVVDGYATLRRLPRLEEVVGSLPSLASLGLDMTVEEAIDLAKEERAQALFEKMKSW
jgi:AbrB family looped-hinge helix DNA binding protein